MGRQREGARGASLRRGRAAVLAGLLALAGCGAEYGEGSPLAVFGGTPFVGAVAAEEPEAALVGEEVLREGGTAADAAVAMYFTLAVTLPTSAGLGSTGACIVYEPLNDRLQLLDFRAVPAGVGNEAVAVPTGPRAMYALSARYGTTPFGTLLVPAERRGRLGIRVSRALAREITAMADPPPALRRPDGRPLAEADPFEALAVGTTIARLRTGVAELYSGPLADSLARAAEEAGLSLSRERLRGATPSWHDVPGFTAGNERIAVAAPLAGDAAAVELGFGALLVDGGWRRADPTTRPAVALSALQEAGLGGDGSQAGATAFSAIDRTGLAVGCAVALNRPFGTGRPLPGLGFVLAPVAPVDAGAGRSFATLIVNRFVRQTHLVATAAGGPAAGSALVQAVLVHWSGDRTPAPAIAGGPPRSAAAPVASSAPTPAQSVAAARVHPGADVALVEPPLPVASAGAGRPARAAEQLGRVSLLHCLGGIPRSGFDCAIVADPRSHGLALLVERSR